MLRCFQLSFIHTRLHWRTTLPEIYVTVAHRAVTMHIHWPKTSEATHPSSYLPLKPALLFFPGCWRGNWGMKRIVICLDYLVEELVFKSQQLALMWSWPHCCLTTSNHDPSALFSVAPQNIMCQTPYPHFYPRENWSSKSHPLFWMDLSHHYQSLKYISYLGYYPAPAFIPAVWLWARYFTSLSLYFYQKKFT